MNRLLSSMYSRILCNKKRRNMFCVRDTISHDHKLLDFFFRSSSPPGSTQGCPGGCAISNCGACYYSYNDLPFPPLPGSCPSVCPLVNGQVDESCMARWGRCVQRSYYAIYQTVNITIMLYSLFSLLKVSERERFKSNFRCWSHECIN